jgi:hypothetical protein
MKRISVLLLALGLGGWIPLQASAAQVAVTYELSGTFSTFLTGPFGPPGSGQVTVVYEKEKGRIAPGAIHVQSFNFAQSLNFSLFGDVFTGAVGFSANPSAPGTLTTGGFFSVFPGSGLLTGNVHCSGSTCFLVGLTPSVTNPLTTPLTGLFASGNLSGTGGPVNIFAAIGTFAGVPISANLTGLEINRSSGARPPVAPELVNICHRPDNLSGWEQISIDAAAVDAHLRNHDDAAPGGVTTESGTSLGADCEPVPI